MLQQSEVANKYMKHELSDLQNKLDNERNRSRLAESKLDEILGESVQMAAHSHQVQSLASSAQTEKVALASLVFSLSVSLSLCLCLCVRALESFHFCSAKSVFMVCSCITIGNSYSRTFEHS